MKLSNKAYDIMKWITMIFLPASGALYSTLAKIWGWPYGAEVAGTLAAITAFFGAILQASSVTYKKMLARQQAKTSAENEV